MLVKDSKSVLSYLLIESLAPLDTGKVMNVMVGNAGEISELVRIALFIKSRLLVLSSESEVWKTYAKVNVTVGIKTCALSWDNLHRKSDNCEIASKSLKQNQWDNPLPHKVLIECVTISEDRKPSKKLSLQTHQDSVTQNSMKKPFHSVSPVHH